MCVCVASALEKLLKISAHNWLTLLFPVFQTRMNHYSQGNEDANCDWQECSSASNFNTLTYNIGRTIQQNNVTLWQGNGKTMWTHARSCISMVCTTYTCMWGERDGGGIGKIIETFDQIESNIHVSFSMYAGPYPCFFIHICMSPSLSSSLCVETLLFLPLQRRVSGYFAGSA